MATCRRGNMRTGVTLGEFLDSEEVFDLSPGPIKLHLEEYNGESWDMIFGVKDEFMNPKECLDYFKANGKRVLYMRVLRWRKVRFKRDRLENSRELVVDNHRYTSNVLGYDIVIHRTLY